MSYIYEVFELLLRLWISLWLHTHTVNSTVFTLTPLPLQTLPQICESWLKSYHMQVCKPCHYALVEAVDCFKRHLMSMSYMCEVFEHPLRLWMGIWLHFHTVTTKDASPDLGKLLKSYLMQGCKPCHYALIEAVEPFELYPLSMAYIYEVFEHPLRLWMSTWLQTHIVTTTDTILLKPCHYTSAEALEPFKLHPMSMSCIYEVLEHLLRLWMGIWLHTHNVITPDLSPDLRELAEILPYASVQTMPLCFGWDCTTFQTASHVHDIHKWGVWVTSKVVDGHMSSHSHCYHLRHFLRFVRVGWNPTLCKCANHATKLWLML
jgi:hypothetical protein